MIKYVDEKSRMYILCFGSKAEVDVLVTQERLRVWERHTYMFGQSPQVIVIQTTVLEE